MEEATQQPQPQPQSQPQPSGYGKKSIWKWLIIYTIIGAIIYGLVYYFVLAKKGGSTYNNSPAVEYNAQ